MNANELADELERFESFNGDVFFGTCAVMLRQQQAEIAELKHMNRNWQISEGMALAEIEALKASHIELERGIVKDLNQRQSVEPVAWRNLCVGNIGEDSEWIYNEIGQGEPLYTHPAKTLTDEEIIEVFESPFYPNTTGKINDEVIAFARAILRKAQEK